MNNVSIIGRLTRDPEAKNSGETAVARFTVAVDRRFTKEGQPDADFISCVAFGKTGEFVEKYFSKGKKIALVGRIQTGSYTNKDGQKVYTTDVVVENVEFVESASASKKDDGDRSGDRGAAEYQKAKKGQKEWQQLEDSDFPF